jgi:hypothetical protein
MHGKHTYPDNTLEVLDRFVGGIARRYLDAGIIEGHVEAPVLGDCSVDGCGDLRFVGDVAGNADGGAAIGDYPRRFGGCELTIQVGQDDLRAALGESARRGQAHAHGGSGNEGHLAGKVIAWVHVGSPFDEKKSSQLREQLLPSQR